MTVALTFAVAAATLLAPFNAGAQGTDEERGASVHARGYFMAGIHGLDLDGLNVRLSERGHPEFSRGFTTLGGGGHVQLGRLLIGGEGHGLVREQ